MSLHFKLVGARYVFRRRVPKHLTDRLGRGELIRSIGSVPYATAMKEARRLVVATDVLFTMLTNNPDLTQAEIDELASQWFREAIARGEQVLTRLTPEDPDDFDAEQRYALRRLEGAKELLRINDWQVVADIASEILAERGIALERKDPRFQELCRKLLRANVASKEVYAKRHEGNYGYRPRDPLFAGKEYAPPVAAPAPPVAAPSVAAPSVAAPVAPPVATPSAPQLFDLIDKHLAFMAREWNPQTLVQNRTTFRFFREHLGDRSVGDVSKRDVSEFLEKLRCLPAKYGQDRAFRGLSFSAMVDKAASMVGMALLSRKTINRHASAVSGMFGWAEKHGYWEGKNPASGFIDKRSDGTGPKRRPWRKEELEILFGSPAWMGAKSANIRSKPGLVVERDAKYWVPLIGLYSGLRLEEICKLRVKDIRQTGDMWVIDVTGDAKNGRVKEDASNRTVPIHPDLIALGLLDHVDAMRTAGDLSLWPELSRGGADGKLSVSISKWFGRYVTGLGLDDPALVFHSFRHSLATALRGEGVAESLITDILGHEHGSISFRVYAEKGAVKPMYEALCRISFGLDIEKLRTAGRM